MLGNPQFGGLLTECKHKTADWISSWMWTCNARDAFDALKNDPDFNMYMVDFRAAYPGPGYGKTGSLQPQFPSIMDCFEDGTGNACHISGQSYFFGREIDQKIAITAAEARFGMRYRTIYADFIRDGNSDELVSWNDNGGKFNIMDIGEAIDDSLPYAPVCGFYDMIQQYGKV